MHVHSSKSQKSNCVFLEKELSDLPSKTKHPSIDIMQISSGLGTLQLENENYRFSSLAYGSRTRRRLSLATVDKRAKA